MKALLRIVLIVVGLLTLIPSVAGVFWPWEELRSLSKDWVDLVLPLAVDSPITVYIFRVMAVTYAWAGFLFILGAANPVKYLVLIRSLALASICVGLACILAGTRLDLPNWAYLCDGIFCLVAGVLVWTLSTVVGPQSQPSPASAEPTA